MSNEAKAALLQSHTALVKLRPGAGSFGDQRERAVILSCPNLSSLTISKNERVPGTRRNSQTVTTHALAEFKTATMGLVNFPADDKKLIKSLSEDSCVTLTRTREVSLFFQFPSAHTGEQWLEAFQWLLTSSASAAAASTPSTPVPLLATTTNSNTVTPGNLTPKSQQPPPLPPPRTHGNASNVGAKATATTVDGTRRVSNVHKRSETSFVAIRDAAANSQPPGPTSSSVHHPAVDGSAASDDHSSEASRPTATKLPTASESPAALTPAGGGGKEATERDKEKKFGEKEKVVEKGLPRASTVMLSQGAVDNVNRENASKPMTPFGPRVNHAKAAGRLSNSTSFVNEKGAPLLSPAPSSPPSAASSVSLQQQPPPPQPKREREREAGDGAAQPPPLPPPKPVREKEREREKGAATAGDGAAGSADEGKAVPPPLPAKASPGQSQFVSLASKADGRWNALVICVYFREGFDNAENALAFGATPHASNHLRRCDGKQ